MMGAWTVMQPYFSPLLAPASARAIEAFMQQGLLRHFPAADLVVLRRGEVLVDGGWGSCEGIAPAPARLYDLASLTKLFTTTLVLVAASRQRLSLDDPLARWVPEFAQGGPRAVDEGQDPHTLERIAVPPARRGQRHDPGAITLRHLLTHTGGLHDWRALFLQLGPVPAPPGPQPAPDAAARRQRAIEAIAGCGLRGPAGGEIVYSDLGFILLGEAVSRALGLPLREAIERWVLDPAQLQGLCFLPLEGGWHSARTILPTELDLRWRQRRAWGEVHDENACAMAGVAGHAGLFGTAMQVARFGQCWLEGGERAWGLSPQLARQAVSAQAADATQRRGLGFMLKAPERPSCGELFDAASFGHTGYTGTSLWVDPRAGLVVACLSNAVYRGRDMSTATMRRELHELLWRACAGAEA